MHQYTSVSNFLLPFDTLVEIFVTCLSLWAEDTLADYQRQLLNWTHVCRDWRYTALNTKSLWTHIDVSKTSLTDPFVKRSGTLPICLTSSSLKPKCAGALMQIGPRVKSIDVRMDFRSTERLFDLLGPALLCLDELKLQTCGWPIRVHVSLPPRLKRLKLSSVTIRLWSHRVYLPELTHLSLAQSMDCSVDQLVMVLEKVPRLEHLELTLVNLLRSCTPNSSTATLPNLHKLYIKIDQADILRLIQRLCLPAKAQIRIDCCYYKYSYVLSSIPIDPRHICLSRDGFQIFDSLSTLQKGDPSESIVWLGWCEPSFVRDEPSRFPALQNVTSLVLGDFRGITRADVLWGSIYSFLHDLPNLENLYVRLDSTERLLSILAGTADLGPCYSSRVSPPCPHLRFISFRPLGPTAVINFATISKLVRERYDATIPLQTIEFVQPSISLATYREEIEKYVDVVIVP